MYVDITNHCPMSCSHCSRDFGKGKPTQGQHMDLELFDWCLDLASELEQGIQLGGGEPTSHPQFWEIWQKSMRRLPEYDEHGVWLATSGFNAARTLDLITIASYEGDGPSLCELHEFEDEVVSDEEYGEYTLTQKGQEMVNALWHGTGFHMALSRDMFHDDIDERIVRAAENTPNVEIRDSMASVKGLMNRGRAKQNQMAPEDNLQCEDIHVDWQGNLTLCSTCPDPRAILGNVRGEADIILDCIRRMQNSYKHFEEDLLGKCKHHWTEAEWLWVIDGIEPNQGENYGYG